MKHPAWCLLLIAGVAHGADRVVTMKKMPPVVKGVDAFPQIDAPQDDAERAINYAVARLDLKVRAAAKDCKTQAAQGEWSRTVTTTMAGPRFISYEISDEMDCGGAHPDSGTTAIVYDLTTGKPVDWTRWLPPSMTATVALTEASDGTKMVTLASKRLYAMYLAGYPKDQDADCKAAIKDVGTDSGAPAMTVWLDAKGDGLAMSFDLSHAVAACEEVVTIPTAALRKEGANSMLADAIDAAHRASH